MFQFVILWYLIPALIVFCVLIRMKIVDSTNLHLANPLLLIALIPGINIMAAFLTIIFALILVRDWVLKK